MARVNKSVAPYYDDYDSSKQYTQLLAVPGRVAQAREITQIQSTMKDIIKSIGDSIMKDGDIIEGCQVIVDKASKSATITVGKVYLSGMVLPVQDIDEKGQPKDIRVSIKGEGPETIGFKLMESIITENEDPKLKDPAQGYDNFNQAGCHRMKSWVNVVVNDPSSALLVNLIDGDVTVEKYAGNYDNLTQTLARRTYDESGSYIVEGLNVRVEPYLLDSSQFTVVIESGKAYILGYEISIPAPRRFQLPRSTTYRGSTLSTTYTKDIAEYVLDENPYVGSIVRVQGTKIARKQLDPGQTMEVGENIYVDSLNSRSAIYIGSEKQNYVYGEDYTFSYSSGKMRIIWKDEYPTSQYTLEYYYLHTFDPSSYDLVMTKDGQHALLWVSDDTPEDNTPLTVDYNYYLARKDTVYLDQYGVVSSIQGTPTSYGDEVAPEAPVNTLAIAVIDSPPGGEVTDDIRLKIAVSNIGLTRFTMDDIQRLVSRIRTIEYDQAVLSLNDEARQYNTSDKRGIFTDPLIDLSRVDYTFNLPGSIAYNESIPSYDMAVDLFSNIGYLPIKSHTYDAIYDIADSSSKRYQRTATLDIERTAGGEERYSVVLSQMNATKAFLVNPYTQFPQLPEISISPAVDTWIEDSIIEVLRSQNASEIVSSSSRHIEVNNTQGVRRASTSNSQVVDTAIGKKVESSTKESVIEESAVKYIRTRDIEVSGTQFEPNLKNILCYFDGTPVPLIPTGDTQASDISGSVAANNEGSFTAKFKIPDNILTGIREVRVESNDSKLEGYENTAFALYQASGTSRKIQRTVTTLTTVLLNRVTTTTTTNYIDPIGQTFVLDRMTIVSGIDLYFMSKPTDNTPITCDIREVVNGNITSTIYGHKTLSAYEVNISSDGRSATRFNFDDPVLLEDNKEYAFVVRSTSPSYSLWVAELGGNDILTGEMVVSNPYLVGVMMSSSNNSSWTVHQTMDIKFSLVEKIYKSKSDIYFNNISAEEFSRVYLLAESIVPDGTDVSWYYSIDDGRNYTPISPYNIVLLGGMSSNILFKATLSRLEDSNLSPIVAIDSVGTVLSSYYNKGYYVSQPITGLDEYTTVDIIIDTSVEDDTRLSVSIASSSRFDTDPIKKADLIGHKDLTHGWVERTYQVKLDSSATYCRVFIGMESDNNYKTPAFRRLRAIMS